MKNRAWKIVGLSFIVISCLSILFQVSSVRNSDSDHNSQEIVLCTTEEITISSINLDPLGANNFLAGSELLFEITDNPKTHSTVSIELTGTTRKFTLTLTWTAGKWYATWDTTEPTAGDDPVPVDTYRIKLFIDTVETDCTPTQLIISGESPLMLIIIIAGIVGAISVSALIVVKKKKGREDVEFRDVDKKKSKKKGTVYSGASAIGRRSGQLVESKQDKEAKESSKPKEGQAKKMKSSELFKGDDKPSGFRKSTSSKKQVMPADSKFSFETKASTSAAMIKSMEMKLDIDNKVSFLLSKTDSILQNIGFFKAVLLQQTQEELRCPTCDKKMTKYWSLCPYCEITEHDSELGLKQSLMSISADVKFCPSCKRIIKSNWSECPYCYTDRNLS